DSGRYYRISGSLFGARATHDWQCCAGAKRIQWSLLRARIHLRRPGAVGSTQPRHVDGEQRARSDGDARFARLVSGADHSGQEGGFLEDVLKRIADFTEHQEDLKSKVVGAMAYPAFLAFAGVSILLVLVIFFVPKFETMFKKLEEKGELPAITSGLLATSHF